MIPDKRKRKVKWIQKAIGEPGALTRKANAAKLSVPAFVAKSTKKNSKASAKTKKQANLAKTLRRVGKKKRMPAKGVGEC